MLQTGSERAVIGRTVADFVRAVGAAEAAQKPGGVGSQADFALIFRSAVEAVGAGPTGPSVHAGSIPGSRGEGKKIPLDNSCHVEYNMEMDEITKPEDEQRVGGDDLREGAEALREMEGEDSPSTSESLARQGKKERKALNKRYLHPFIREADAKMAKLPYMKKGEGSAKVRALMRGADGMERTALQEVLYLYAFAGLSTREISQHMDIDRRIIKRVMMDPRYAQGYDIFKREVVGKIADAMTMMVQETMLDAMQVKITLLHKSKSEWLKNTIANEIIAMGTEITHGKGGGLSDELTAIWTRAVKKVRPDGSVVTEKQTIRGALGDGSVTVDPA